MDANKTALALLMLVLLLCLATPAICQDEEGYDDASTEYGYTDDGYESESEFGLGTVIEITESTVKLSEDGYGDEISTEVLYIVDEKTRFSNINSLSEIKNGNTAYIDYIEKDGKKLILSIDIESGEIE